MAKPDTSSEIEVIASEWALRSAETELSAADIKKRDLWLEADNRHLGAYVRASATWVRLDSVAAMARSGDYEEAKPRPVLPQYFRIGAIAAAIVIALFIGNWFREGMSNQFTTNRENVLHAALDDGSNLVLNGDSAVKVKFGDSERKLVVDRGEAFFDVAHDASRPFVVETPNLTVKAIGTKFSVGLDGNGDVSVVVTEGTVAVEPKGRGAIKLLHANQALEIRNGEAHQVALTHATISRRSAWQKGLVMFDGETLVAAADTVNRYAAKPVVIDDPKLSEAKFVGVFRIGNSRAFADAAAAAFNGKVTETDRAYHVDRQAMSPAH